MDIDQNETLGKLFTQEKKVSNKERLAEIKLFKIRIIDFLAKYFDKIKPNNTTIAQCSSLLKHALASQDSSVKSLSQKIIFILNSFFLKNKDVILKEKFISENKQNYEALFELLFHILASKNQNKHNLISIINIIKIFSANMNITLNGIISLKSEKMLSNLFNHKDNSVFKIVLPN